jgi:large subunit ribosomal protein L25
MEVMTLNALPRTDLGKTATKAVRRENRIPCVLYGGPDIRHFTLAPLDLRELVYSPEFKVVEINLEGEVQRCILKDVQYHPVTEAILHIDFLRLIENKPIKIEVPIRFEGIATGIKSGGKLIKKMRKVKVKTLPEHLIDKMVLDTTPMALGQSQRIKDLKTYEGVQVLNNENIPIATVDIPRALRGGTEEVAPAAGAVAAPGAPAAGAKAPAAPAKEAAPKSDKK